MPYIDYNNRKKVEVFPGIIGTLFHSEKATIARLTADKGTIIPEHKHPHEQWMNVIEGEFEFVLNGKKRILTKGMTALIHSNEPHSARAITECKIIDCFFPIREDFIELENETPDLKVV